MVGTVPGAVAGPADRHRDGRRADRRPARHHGAAGMDPVGGIRADLGSQAAVHIQQPVERSRYLLDRQHADARRALAPQRLCGKLLAIRCSGVVVGQRFNGYPERNALRAGAAAQAGDPDRRSVGDLDRRDAELGRRLPRRCPHPADRVPDAVPDRRRCVAGRGYGDWHDRHGHGPDAGCRLRVPCPRRDRLPRRLLVQHRYCDHDLGGQVHTTGDACAGAERAGGRGAIERAVGPAFRDTPRHGRADAGRHRRRRSGERPGRIRQRLHGAQP